jgi:hypothetical protein
MPATRDAKGNFFGWSDRRWNVIGIGVVACLILIGLIAVRPAVVTGVSGAKLLRSVEGTIPDSTGALGGYGGCEKRQGDRWNCLVPGSEGSGGTWAYSVSVDQWGCWTARSAESQRDVPPRAHGCIGIFDLFEIF